MMRISAGNLDMGDDIVAFGFFLEELLKLGGKI